MLNSKPKGPEVVILVSYAGEWIYRYAATDDNHELEGLEGPELTAKLAALLHEEVKAGRLARLPKRDGEFIREAEFAQTLK